MRHVSFLQRTWPTPTRFLRVRSTLRPDIISRRLDTVPKPLIRNLSTEINTSSPTLDLDPPHPSLLRLDSQATASEATRLNPSPDDYGGSHFSDKCRVTIFAGSGGNGCVSFLRDRFIAEGPPNGGDGGSGGNVYIQAVEAETSLHKLSRRRIIRAGNGRHGRGSSQGGPRGSDVLLEVPVGTIVREIAREDPVQMEEESYDAQDTHNVEERANSGMVWSHKWILSPSVLPRHYNETDFPAYPGPRRSNLAAKQLPQPIQLDLATPSPEPQLLAAGAVGGLGNPHFATKSITRPKFGTRGDRGMRLELEFELKLLADLGLVGMPNAGKSTLLRALTNSRARVGSWAFTTLQPNIGTVVLDRNQGRVRYEATNDQGKRMKKFTIADIPGLVADAHLDRGLGLEFLRHVERAGALAFVVDLSDGDPIENLRILWHELTAFQRIKDEQQILQTPQLVSWRAGGPKRSISTSGDVSIVTEQDPTSSRAHVAAPMSAKPWFVVATKADLQGTQEAFGKLQQYLDRLEQGSEPHPSQSEEHWSGPLRAIPVSAIKGEGVERIVQHALRLLAQSTPSRP